MEPLPNDQRTAVRGLYEGFPGLHGAIDSVLEGVVGELFVDDRLKPRVARAVVGDFHAIAGDPESSSAPAALRAVPDGEYIAVHPSWHELVRQTLPAAQTYDRFGFSAPAKWDRGRLESFRESLPPEYALHRIDAEMVAGFRALNETFVDNFASLDDFLRLGVGFGITEEGKFIAGCSSYTISSRCLEFEIETRGDHRRRGLALVTGSRMIEHCLDNGLEPCWDAAHEGSALLAEALGFVGRRPYTAYRLGSPETPES